MRKSVALVSFGCAKNLVDSEVMAGLLARSGYASSGRPAEADVVVLNTCGFIKPARDEAEAAIRQALRTKSKNPGQKVIVAGCYVERDRNALSQRYPQVDGWIGVREFDKIADLLEGGRPRPGRGTFLYSHTSPRVVSTPKGWAYVKISEGCSHECGFCTIPLIKGPYRSRPESSILAEVQGLAAAGVREINLISQDTTYYGRDRGVKDGLAKLLGKLVDVAGLSWIRLLYGYPEEVTDALLEVMQEAKVCRYLDIPFQHADPRVLRRMRRSMDGRRALHLVERIRRRLPGVALRTSLIVGYPGEGRREFRALQEFVEEAAFDHLGVFTYSSEEGTPAAILLDTVSESEKRRRRDALMTAQARISAQNNQRYRGQRLEVLVDGVAKTDALLGLSRSRFQAPEVDGIVRVRSRKPVADVLGTIREVEIVASGVYDLRGTFME